MFPFERCSSHLIRGVQGWSIMHKKQVRCYPAAQLLPTQWTGFITTNSEVDLNFFTQRSLTKPITTSLKRVPLCSSHLALKMHGVKQNTG